MASVTGITAAKALEILGESVTSGFINGSGHLILVRDNAETIDAGDFTAIVTGIMDDAVASEVAAQNIPGQVETEVTNRVVGIKTALGSTSAIDLSAYDPDDLVNALFTVTLNGNVTLSPASFPAATRPNTQFAIIFKQDAAGVRTLTLTSIKKSQGVLALTTIPNATDIIVFMYDGATWYAGPMGIGFS